jgi:hypothetical protein
VTTQKKGLVSLFWMLNSKHSEKDLSQNPALGRMAAVSLGPFVGAFPIRFSALHVCFYERSFQQIVNLGAMAIERAARVRVRAHYGKNNFPGNGSFGRLHHCYVFI